MDDTMNDTTIRLSHAQYRDLAEICKREAGKPLNLSSPTDMEGSWGMYTYWAELVYGDVAASHWGGHERAYIYLASRLNPDQVRAAGRSRPECDWSALADDEIYPFIVWHEIGHVRDNFAPMDAMLTKTPVPEKVCASLELVNEVLADRFAWDRVRSGEAMPLTEAGKRDATRIEEAIQEAGKYLERAKHKVKPLPAGRYCSIPATMLATKKRAAFIGPDINPDLLARELATHRHYFESHGRYRRRVTL